ncbi:translation initiation factor IF-2 [Oryctolagus cuniculus]|uniref:translation initiation factor IF-2 n=1 Tax=Oryctolagus cuniculus TaxID=9986 RepID=UPI003879DC30
MRQDHEPLMDQSSHSVPDSNIPAALRQHIHGLATVLPAPGGARGSLPLAPRKDDTRSRSREKAEVGWRTSEAGGGDTQPPSPGTPSPGPPSPGSRCAPPAGAPRPRTRGPASAGGRGGAAGPPPPRAPARPLDSPAAAAAAALSCAGSREPSPPGAGRRLAAPGRRLSKRRAPSRAGSLVPGGCDGRGAAEGCGQGGATGSLGPRTRCRHRLSSPSSSSSLGWASPSLPRSPPAGPVSGLGAEDRPPGAALRLLRRRMRRPPPPGLAPAPEPRGTPGLRPAEKAPRGSGQPRRGAPRAAHARTPAPGPPPHPRANDAGRAQGRALAAAGLRLLAGSHLMSASSVPGPALALGVRPLGFLGAARWTDCPHTTRREELGPEPEADGRRQLLKRNHSSEEVERSRLRIQPGSGSLQLVEGQGGAERTWRKARGSPVTISSEALILGIVPL